MDQSGIADRRRLRRKLTFWRIVAFAVVIAGVVWLVMSAGPSDPIGGKSTAHVARVTISGVITDNAELIERLDTIRQSDRAKALIVRLQSPGGTSYGGETLYKAVRAVAAEKPVVAEIRTLAASAAYMIACGSDYIIAGDTSIVGSIGVIFQYAQVADLLEKVGVSVQEIKSAPLKAEPSPFHQASPQARAMIRSMVNDSYDWFVDIVAECRGLSRTDTLELADGSIFTGRQAADNGLVDIIGGDTEIRDYLSGKGVPESLKIVDWERRKSRGELLFGNAVIRLLTAWQGDAIPFADQFQQLIDRKLFLDGLVSVWQFGPAED
ncbi:signal peptide peptidase SppA [Nitratireductor sp. XY-223]|uniref:signal peptide peptidase SppA n=1 Tax=Nitratireductor sp. XY-223 TaxID=2561926 RepID=UPI0010AAE261|nr:signal peptide peptidase SppA [Nitratireductor sp. XY-223]